MKKYVKIIINVLAFIGLINLFIIGNPITKVISAIITVVYLLDLKFKKGLFTYKNCLKGIVFFILLIINLGLICDIFHGLNGTHNCCC